ncbi:YMR144W [Saccharomyces arboricola H-6]|uniref:YMR144W n=1 Tax=Saccharomyces arboricola (strain H-6 / AS 2.3317 / CBS 10644) TaxID=1160507 RepID=J8Q6K0_SACAR|nr:YMR144W [Saccharomyces arboricola H-6]
MEANKVGGAKSIQLAPWSNNTMSPEDSGSDVQSVIQKASRMIRQLNHIGLMSPTEDEYAQPSSSQETLSVDREPSGQGQARLVQVGGSNSEKESNVYSGLTDSAYGRENILNVLQSLVSHLNQAASQIQQLKFKNMILASNENNIQSRHEVEDNLQKQQFERMKCQFLLEHQSIKDQLRKRDNKIVKYKQKIIEKNRKLNNLTKVLNQHAVSDTSNIDSFSSLIKRTPSSTATPQETKSDMLNTLGILATHVLKDEIDDDSGNQTVLQLAAGSISNDCNTTELEITCSPETGSTVTHNRPHIKVERARDSHGNKTLQLPKMKSFSTIDGTIKDIN